MIAKQLFDATAALSKSVELLMPICEHSKNVCDETDWECEDCPFGIITDRDDDGCIYEIVKRKKIFLLNAYIKLKVESTDENNAD